MEVDPMDTREGRLKNNADIIRGEDGTDVEVFYNEIETRLGLPIEIRTEADENLGAAYVASLARYEAEDEWATWCPILPSELVAEFKVTQAEAEVVAILAAREYPGPEFIRKPE